MGIARERQLALQGHNLSLLGNAGLVPSRRDLPGTWQMELTLHTLIL